MSRTRIAVVTFCIVFLLLAWSSGLGVRPLGPTASAGVVTTGQVAVPPDVGLTLLASYLHAVEQAHVADYVHAVTMSNVAVYVDAVAASDAQAAADAEQAAGAARERGASQAPTGTASQPSGGSTGPPGACGGASNGADQYIHRESGGDPYIINGGGHASSPQAAGRAFGCYQILPSTWQSSCSDITTYDPASQARCASRLPDSAWALLT